MVLGGEIHQAGNWSRQALERLAQDDLLPTPANYAVYYHYYAGNLSALNAAYDVIAARGKITPRECTDLYDKYIVADTEMLFLKKANSVVDGELKKMMELLSASAQGTNQFGENLDAFSGQVTSAASIEALRDAVEKITEETRAIAAQNHKLQDELEATSHQLSEVRSDFERVHKESQIDPLTEVGNRKFFGQEMDRVITEAREQKSVLSLVMVDIDHFKKFNDTHGHLIGDQVLRLVARTLIENLKGRDIIARYGGEEFVILLPQTRLQDAERVANQLRASLATKQIRKRNSQEILGAITISLGAAEFLPEEDSETLISRADAALYKAKQTGRNKVVCADVGNSGT
ncbi:MAG: GGDEF domain-containing protein [Alphaproteobacteria bacterium]